MLLSKQFYNSTHLEYSSSNAVGDWRLFQMPINSIWFGRQMKTRVQWIDVVKGIGIILVIVGHSGCSQTILKYIQSFHMPLFFVVAGYLFTEYQSTSDLIRRKRVALLRPYCFYGLLNYAITVLRIAIKDGVNDELFHTAIRYIVGLVYSRGTWYWMPNCSPIWFLTAMFVAVIVFNQIVKLKDVYRYLLAGASFLIACVFCQIGLFKLPWNIDTALWSQPYLLLGYKLKQADFPVVVKSRRAKWSIVALGLFVVGSIAAIKNDVPFISMDSMIMGNYAFMLISTVFISVALIISCILYLPYNLIVEVFGRNTVTILGLNYLVNTIVNSVWHSLLPDGNPFLIWAGQCFLQIAALGLLAFISDHRKRKVREPEK